MVFAVIIVSMLLFYSVNEASSGKRPEAETPNPIATVVLSNKAVIKVELYPEHAPNTVNNFIDLVNKKFYDGMTFSKVVPNYLLQTGDPIGDGTGFPGYFIKSECKQNGFKNKLKCEVGTLCMARARKYNTEGSQFFILLEDDSGLNGQYTAFGKVVEGLSKLKEIGQMAADTDNSLVEDIKIQSITVDTFGVLYSEPQVISIFEHRDS